MKRVMNSSMVAHVWANQSQDEARTPTRNFYFVGPTLYSYGSHFAVASFQRLGGREVILWNESNYSKTTSGHKSDALRGLSFSQKALLVSVPTLTRDLCRGTPTAWRQLGENCKDAGVALCADVQKRVKVETASADYRQALRHFEHAAMFYAEAGDKRNAQAFTVADADRIPDGATVKEIRALALKWAKVKVRADMLADYESAKREHASLARNIARQSESLDYAAQNLVAQANRAARFVADAIKARTNLGMAPSRDYAKLACEIAALAPRAQELSDAYQARIRARDYARYLHSYYVARHHERRERKPDLGAYSGAAWFAGQCAQFEGCDPRIIRVAEAADLRRALRDTREATTSGEFSRAIRLADSWLDEDQSAGRLRAYIAAQRDAWIAKRDALEASEAAERADKVQRWLAGDRDVRPSYDWPTMARIRGDIVETTKGATVPLEHAQRLVRIARRVIARGGEVFAPGAGPMVGHFRVNLIDGNGRVVIGCHEFTEPETSRLMALIESTMPAAIAPHLDV